MACKRIGILTGGGDCPGLNAVLRAVVKPALYDHKLEVVGFIDGYKGLTEGNYKMLHQHDVSGILFQGGTILGTSNTADPYHVPVMQRGKPVKKDMSRHALNVYRKLKLDALICVGGDGTMSIAYKLHRDGMNIVGVPKTIDNDLVGTDKTFGADTAIAFAAEAIDRLHSTAEAHHRVIVVEVMGRYAGWISLFAGFAGGADVILIPEIPFIMDNIIEVFQRRKAMGKRSSIVCVAEGAKPKGGSMVVQKTVKDSPDPIRLGGVGMKLADALESRIQQECRVVVLGHLQRGGGPIPSDRILASQYGYEALHAVLNGKFGCMIGLKGNTIVHVPLDKIAGKTRNVPKNHPLIIMAREMGIGFGN